MWKIRWVISADMKTTVSKAEGRSMEITQTETQREKWVGMRGVGQKSTKLWDNIKHSHIHVSRRGEQRAEEIMVEKFPKLMTQTKPQIQEAQRTSSMINQKTNNNNNKNPGYMSLPNCWKQKVRILKAARGERNITHRRTKIRTTAGFLWKTM